MAKSKKNTSALVKAEWTGAYPNLCSGYWILEVAGRDFSYLLSEFGEMNTYGTYRSWGFNSEWMEEWDTYEDGLHYPEWVDENRDWLEVIATDPVVELKVGSDTEKLYRAIYDAISEEDWRHGECGGCI